MNICLISCVSKKRNEKCKAQYLYISPLFMKSLRYAKNNNFDNIYILSAKYGLLELDEIIEPYDLTLNDMNEAEIEEWSKNVLCKLKLKTDLQQDNFIILAGRNYYKNIIPFIQNYSLPLGNLGIGERLQFLDKNTFNQFNLLN